MMGDRLKIFAIVAVLGFLAGGIVQLTMDYAIPWLSSVLPALFQVRFVVAGFAGACLTLVLVSAWGYLTSRNENRL
jgi:hypothetical protein